MPRYNVYVLTLCIIVFVLLTAVFSALLIIIARQEIMLIGTGAEDDALLAERESAERRKKSRALKAFNVALTTAMWVVLIAVLGFAVYAGLSDVAKVGKIPLIKSVETGSMSYAHEDNAYLERDGVTNRIQTHDLIILHALPPEDELHKYDIILYEGPDGLPVLHRIVEIKDTKEGRRKFRTQGDAVPSMDGHAVWYKDMRGVYRGERIAGIGSFVSFMHSPAGYICIILVIVTAIAMPIFDRTLNRIKAARLAVIDAAAGEKPGTGGQQGGDGLSPDGEFPFRPLPEDEYLPDEPFPPDTDGVPEGDPGDVFPEDADYAVPSDYGDFPEYLGPDEETYGQ